MTSGRSCTCGRAATRSWSSARTRSRSRCTLLRQKPEVQQAARILHLERGLLIKHLRRAGIQTWIGMCPNRSTRSCAIRYRARRNYSGRWGGSRHEICQDISILVAAGALARGYYEAGHNTSAIWLLVLGAAWLLAEIRRLRWFASLGFLACVASAGYGLWIDLSALWMLAGAVAALIAWDLSDFLLPRAGCRARG